MAQTPDFIPATKQEVPDFIPVKAAAPAENPVTAPLSKATSIGPRKWDIPWLEEAEQGYRSVGLPRGEKGRPELGDQGSVSGNLGQFAGVLVKNPATQALAATMLPAESPLPSTARAGKKFEDVLSAAKNVPVNVEKTGAAGLRAKELVERGSSPVQVINKFMNRVTDPEKGPLTYDEARDFYVNARMNMMERWKNVGGPMWRQVTIFKEALGQAIEDAAAAVGKLPEYQEAMEEYQAAVKLKRLGIGAIATSAGAATTKLPVIGSYIKGAVKGSLSK